MAVCVISELTYGNGNPKEHPEGEGGGCQAALPPHGNLIKNTDFVHTFYIIYPSAKIS
jgi:hypothetical protein